MLSTNAQIKDDGDVERSQQYHDVVSRHHQREPDRRHDDNEDEDKFVRQLKELVTVLRDKVQDTLDQCTAVDQPCLHDHHDDDHLGGPRCCRGLRCSAAGRCSVDCVSHGQSCRHNWFCCDGRRCTRRNDDFICE